MAHIDKMSKEDVYGILSTLGEIKGMTHFSHYTSSDDKKKTGLQMDKEKRTDHQGWELIDGFNFNVAGNILILRYHAQEDLEFVNSFEKIDQYHDHVVDIMNDNMKFIKDKFKEISDKELRLKLLGEPKVELTYYNRNRSWVTGYMRFKISNLTDEDLEQEEDNPDKRFDDRSDWFNKFR